MNGGVERVNGGDSFGSTIDFGGRQDITGGTSTRADINDGSVEIAHHGGTSTGTMINDGGREDVRGGTSTDTTIHFGGLEVVGSGGTAVSTTIADGVETVRNGGKADAVTFDGSHGTLNLTNPSEFDHGTATNWRVGDVIDF